ncbi:hypothetical protein VNO78_25096 [Psophocarpus tetragonolobus]|uniref:Embryo defective 1703 n=1 Tax=Psophocarpus tetragonolobus TaxID=3891 RepID=A0AAN9XF21_PSOTE
MEILNISSPTTFPIPTFCHPKTLSSKFPPNHTKPTFPFRRTPFSPYLSRSAATKFQTWAHSGRTTNRRNSLRKKLVRDHKVNPNQIPNDPFSVSGNGVEESGVGVQRVSVVDNVVEVEKSKSKLLGESVLWNKLENWVDQYKRDIEYWGVGSGPIFTVYEDPIGGVKRVFVDEDQILKRSKVGRDEIEDFPEVRSKLLNAKNLAKEVESGNNVIARNSSVAKFVVQGKEEGGFVKAVQGFVVKPRLLPRLSGVGRKVLYGLVVVWVAKKLFAFGEGEKEVEYTPMEKEMMRRKIKARKEKEELVKGTVEVVLEPSETPMVEIKRPKLDKEQLRNSILKVKHSTDKLLVHDSADKVKARSTEMDYKVQEIREMARQARKIEGRDDIVVNKDMEMDDPVIEKSSNDNEKKNSQQDDGLSNHRNEVAKESIDSNAVMHSTSVDVPENIDDSVLHEKVPADKGNLYALNAVVLGDSEIKNGNVKPLDTSINGSSVKNESSLKKKTRIIQSVKEARDYLSKKLNKQYSGTGTESKIEPVKENIADLKSSNVIDFNGQKYQSLEKNKMVSKSGTLNGISDFKPLINASEDSNQKDKKLSPRKNEYIKDSGIEPQLEELQKYETTLDHEVGGISTDTRLHVKPENWLEKKLKKDEPIIEQTRGDALDGLSDFKLASNPSRDSNKKDKEFSPTKDDYFKGSSVEPGLGNLHKSDNTLDHEINGIGMETRLPVKPENWPDKILLEAEQSRSDALDGLSDSRPATNPSEDSEQNKEFGTTKDDYVKGAGIEPGIRNHPKSDTTLDHEINGIGTETRLAVKAENFPDKDLLQVEQIRSDALSGLSYSKPATDPSEESDLNNREFGTTKDDYLKNTGVQPGIGNHQKPGTALDSELNGIGRETTVSGKTENWMEKNFHEVEPIVKQIRAGFRNNYMAAKERVNQPLDIPTERESLGGVEDGRELDWMQDDHLRDIVFQVRENELSGRDPFYLMNDEDKDTFFRGLEKKVEKENKNLSHIHEWLHSNIENLDYGADGISIYDPPEKIIPRWKGPPVEKIPEFLNEFLDERKAVSSRNMNPVKKDDGFAKTSADSSLQVKVDGSTAPIKKLKNPKTIIEGSDGSVKVGKKSGKEYWQHTKKWSQGFLDCYNDETDPEIKSVMKDMGKDLDRWITEKEIEEAAELMDKLPDRNRSFMEKKLNKIKREMELFGPQAVVSKYREYADDKEEDYLWWLDLSHILCIELYTVEEGEQKIGLYSLEMATDLELEPKPYHVIAFQDPGDCKNLCYIIQAHMELLGNGHAFVVARPPKDAFREAKANGFGVTVIKKGELQLNIDQPLEEVEEQITEIGSKMYHDMMMKERSVDINTLMKGVFGFSDRTIKRLKRKVKKSRKG